MATGFAPFLDARDSPSRPTPFLLSPEPRQPDFAAALEAAVVAERALRHVRRNSPCRVSYLLCEVASQMRRQSGASSPPASIPITRYQLSELLGMPLAKVKRVLALLGLSGVVTTAEGGIEVTDWRRLCAMAHADPERLGVEPEDSDDAAAGPVLDGEEAPFLSTASGEPATFV